MYIISNFYHVRVNEGNDTCINHCVDENGPEGKNELKLEHD